MVHKKVMEADVRNCVIYAVALTESFGVFDSVSLSG